ncbi:MAG: cytidine/deoxycytidylate deaminase family protein [Candidatus Hodarchaeota archaeon]
MGKLINIDKISQIKKNSNASIDLINRTFSNINFEQKSPIIRKIRSNENTNFSTLEIFTYKKLKLEKIKMDDYSSIYDRLDKLSKKSNCMLRSVAALIAKDGLILSEAYNHTSKYMKCERTEPLEDSKKNYDHRPQYPCSKYQFICRANHAEQIAIFKALNSGIQLDNATLYVTTSPCLMCAHAIFLSGISRVISFSNHRIQDGVEYLTLNNVRYSVITVL